MIADRPLAMECKLVQPVDLPTNTLFIGEIKNICSENGKPGVNKVRPFLLTMPKNRFWSLGGQVGHAWKDAIQYKEKLSEK